MDTNRTQRQIATLLTIFGLSVFLADIIILLIIREEGFLSLITNLSFIMAVALSILLAATRTVYTVWVRILHVLSLLAVGILGVMDTHDSFYGLGFFIMAVVLSFKYEFFNSHPRLKLGIVGLVFSSIVELSAYLEIPRELGVGLSVILFLGIFLVIIFTIYKSDIDRIESSKIHLEKSLSELIAEKSRLERDLSLQTIKIADFEREIDRAIRTNIGNVENLREVYGLTKKELEVIIIAYETGKTNQEIADILNISLGTIKQHLSRAYVKLHVRNRSRMLAMIRDYLATGLLPAG